MVVVVVVGGGGGGGGGGGAVVPHRQASVCPVCSSLLGQISLQDGFLVT